MLDMREADRITTQSNTESKFSTSSQGSGVFWKPMVYLTSSSEAGSSTGSQHNMLHPRRGQRLAAERSQGSEADSFDIDERRFFKPSRQCFWEQPGRYASGIKSTNGRRTLQVDGDGAALLRPPLAASGCCVP
ncbi:unnamed protein product [Durusdinium trenchii]|uniref:Uncharacterized protein n=1 Tax=Durusdinium trenchii TaxID=1381693 RepID=A0ABP0SVJ2_9DINO